MFNSGNYLNDTGEYQQALAGRHKAYDDYVTKAYNTARSRKSNAIANLDAKAQQDGQKVMDNIALGEATPAVKWLAGKTVGSFVNPYLEAPVNALSTSVRQTASNLGDAVTSGGKELATNAGEMGLDVGKAGLKIAGQTVEAGTRLAGAAAEAAGSAIETGASAVGGAIASGAEAAAGAITAAPSAMRNVVSSMRGEAAPTETAYEMTNEAAGGGANVGGQMSSAEQAAEAARNYRPLPADDDETVWDGDRSYQNFDGIQTPARDEPTAYRSTDQAAMDADAQGGGGTRTQVADADADVDAATDTATQAVTDAGTKVATDGGTIAATDVAGAGAEDTLETVAASNIEDPVGWLAGIAAAGLAIFGGVSAEETEGKDEAAAAALTAAKTNVANLAPPPTSAGVGAVTAQPSALASTY